MSGGMHNAEFNLIKAYDVAIGNKHIGSKGFVGIAGAEICHVLYRIIKHTFVL